MKAQIIPLIKDQPDTYDDLIAYFPDSLRFFEVNRKTASIISKVSDGTSYEDLLQEYPMLSESDFSNIYTCCHEKAKARQFSNSSTLGRLVINVSNTCNLACKYCYAEGGSYGSDYMLMSEATLKNVLDCFYGIFDTIDIIQMFGGEPTINVKAMRFICEYLASLNKTTQLGMVSNGTIMSDELLRLIKKNNIHTTISIDCREIHDELRPFVTSSTASKGSYTAIVENIRLLHESTGQPEQLEVTYTDLHVRHNISICQLIESVYSDIGFEVPVHIAPVCTDNSEYILDSPKAFSDSIDDYFLNLSAGKDIPHSLVGRFLWSLRGKTASTHYCGAGFGTISVACNGDISPCFYFTGDSKFTVGNACKDSPEALLGKIAAMKENFLDYKKNSGAKCKDCYANTVCFGCLGANYKSTEDEFVASDFQCKMVRDGLVATLRNLIYQKRIAIDARGRRSK